MAVSEQRVFQRLDVAAEGFSWEQAIIETPVSRSAPYDAFPQKDAEAASEYETEIGEYLRHLEFTTMASSERICVHNSISWDDRRQLVNWMAEVSHELDQMQETLFLSINLVDRFLGERAVSFNELQ